MSRLSGSVAAIVVTGALSAQLEGQALGNPPAPFENPTTPAKVDLGKILFWDEQLSSDNTVACGTCHQPAAGGADARIGRHPGWDGVFNTPDDVLGSPGIVGSDATGDYRPSPHFGLDTQITGRTTPTSIGAAYLSTLRWDGRALETFIDPQTQQVLIMFGGALENHALGPPTDGAEMAYDQRTWHDIAAKIQRVRPLALATNLPPDMATTLSGNPDYGELVRRAFGDRTVTGTRITYALAAYQRTLVPDRSPWDRFIAGNPSALTPDQQAGLTLFKGAANCAQCHTPPLFSDGSFRNLGIRPPHEDRGWQLATFDPIDRGKFKVPSLRNAGLRNRFMHNGQLTTLAEVVDFYDAGGGAFLDNKDPALVPLNLTPQQKAQLVDFVQNSLTDPRVATEQFPFDRPTLYSEHAITSFGAPHPGSGGQVPRALFDAPMSYGNAEFRVGITDALGGAVAAVAFAGAKGPPGQMFGPVPIHIALVPAPTILSVPLQGTGVGGGYGTLRVAIPDDPSLVGAPLYHQWLVVDSGAAGGLAATAGAGGTLF